MISQNNAQSFMTGKSEEYQRKVTDIFKRPYLLWLVPFCSQMLSATEIIILQYMYTVFS